MADETSPKTDEPVAPVAADPAPPGPEPAARVRKPPDTAVVYEDRSKELGSPGEHKHGDLTVTTR